MDNKEQIAQCLEIIELEALKATTAMIALERGDIPDVQMAFTATKESAAKAIKASLKLRTLLGVPLKSEGKQ